MMKTKYSYGIGCFRIHNGIPEILLVQKRHTYSFVTFVLCCDKIRNHNRLHQLFDSMTYQEKLDIKELDYDKLWTKICGRIPPQPINAEEPNTSYVYGSPSDGQDIKRHYKYRNFNKKMYSPQSTDQNDYSLESWNTYITRKVYFDTTYGANVKLLYRLMKDTKCVNTLWDIPKGRRKYDTEKNFDVALREFREETTGTIHNITPFLHVKPITFCYIDGKWKYINLFFIAQSDNPEWTPSIEFTGDELMEVQDAQWFGLARLKAIDPNSKYHQRLVSIVELLMHKYKKTRKI